jgi:radical SAM protein with 4Fe4S-binding SPASM domain
MCPRNDPNFQEGEMSYSMFTRIIDRLPFLKGAQLQGLGEPFLHKDLFRMIEYLHDRKMNSLVVTNGTLLNDENMERIFGSGLNIVHISVDSANPEVYESIRVGAKLDEVKRNVRRLVERRNELKSKLKVNINSVLMRRNYREVEGMVRLGSEVGVDLVNFCDIQYSFDVGISTRYESLRLASEEEKKEIQRLFRSAKTLSEKEHIPINLPRLEQPRIRQNCEQPWVYLVVAENGKVRPCCAIHHKEFGDLTTQDYRSVWNNSEFQTFRRMLVSDDIPIECKDCGML